jgi:uncharacterized protein involved in exopolysaccharide biosynthesis
MTSQPTEGLSAGSARRGDEISLVEIANAILRNWRAVLVLPLLLAVIVGALTMTRERTFAATGSFMPQTADNRGLAGAAALAQQFGVNLGSERPGQSPQFYVDLLRSGTVLRRAVETQYRAPVENDGEWSGNLVQYWEIEEDGRQPPWRTAVERLRGAISTSIGRETGVVEIKVSMDHPLLAESVAETLLDLLNDYNMELRQLRGRDEERFIKGRLTDAEEQVLSAEAGLESFLRQNRAFRNSPELLFEHDRLQRQVMMHQEVYTSLLRALEQARIDGVRDTPLLTIIDRPAGSAEPEGRGTVLRAVIAFLLGLMLAVGFAGVKEAARRSRQADDPHYREFENLARGAWSDIRRPTRWFGRAEKRVAAGKD